MDDLSSFSKETSVEKNEEKLNINYKFKINEEALDREARMDYRQDRPEIRTDHRQADWLQTSENRPLKSMSKFNSATDL